MKNTIKHYLKALLITLFFNSSLTSAEEYVWGEDFEEGDIISAATFNQIFAALQKLNRTPVDADLVGQSFQCN